VIKVKTLEGIDSFYATQGFHKLMFGLKCLPTYLGESYEEFFDRIDQMDEADQEKMIRQAAVFVKLEPDEQSDVMKWALDANGVPYTKENSRSLKPSEIHEIIVAVCKVIARDHKINFISNSEKKNLKISQSTSDKSLPSIQASH
jgi:hypothetical protein